jgi:hypothetical protein
MKRMHMVVCIALAASTAACAKARHEPDGEGAEAEKDAFGKLTSDELSARMSDAKAGKIKLAIFDTNDHERFEKSHIPGAKWVVFNGVKASDLPADRDTTLVFYCAHAL